MTWTEPAIQRLIREMRRDQSAVLVPGWDRTAQAVDQSGNGNHGSYTGTYVMGQPGPFSGARAVQFDGSTGYATLGNPASLASGLTGLTAGAWARWTGTAGNTGGSKSILRKQQTSGSASTFALGAGWDGAHQHARLYIVVGGSFFFADGTSNVADGRWHHICGTYDGATIRIYVDGRQESATAQTGALSGGSSTLSIGAYADSTGDKELWQGPLALAEVLTYALSPSRVAARYAVATGRQSARRISVPVSTGGRLLLLHRQNAAAA